MTDRLAELLREVDASAPPPAAAGDVVAAVSRRRIRRRRSRILTSAAAIGIAAVIVLMSMQTGVPTPNAPVASSPVVEPVRETPLAKSSADTSPVAAAPSATVAELKPETLVRIHELTIGKLHSRQARRRSRQDALARDFAPSPRELRDRAALILIYDADELLRAHRHDDAVALYRRAMNLFPQSPWADVARQRLNRS